MRRFGLSEWSSVAEIVGTIAVVISLLFVAQSINRNTDEIHAQQLNDLYDANREIELTLASDATWSDIVTRGNVQSSDLSESEKYRYDKYWAAHLNLWEQLIGRHEQGMIPQSHYSGWNTAYAYLVGESLDVETWERLKPFFPGPEIQRRIEEAIKRR